MVGINIIYFIYPKNESNVLINRKTNLIAEPKRDDMRFCTIPFVIEQILWSFLGSELLPLLLYRIGKDDFF